MRRVEVSIDVNPLHNCSVARFTNFASSVSALSMKPPHINFKSVTVHFIAYALVFLSLAVHAGRPEYTRNAAPSWVVSHLPALNAKPPLDQISSGVHYLLHDMQVRIEGDDRVSYRHLAIKAINQKGLESAAQIDVRFDPSYQTLSLHELTVHRGGKKIEKLKSASVKVLQREKELEYLVYDGSKTASIFLDDVQVGDVVEYSYSLHGSNPVFGGRHAGRLELQWSVPVYQARASIELAANRLVTIKNRNHSVNAIVSESRGLRRMEWSRSDVPALVVEADAPGSYDPYQAVEWSEFANWGAVAKWAAPLYALADGASAVAAVADKIRTSHSNVSEQAMQALRYVQREIRYLSVAVGAGSHAPSLPSKVLERRFGDCKDKALLLVAILRELGIDAKVALVNTITLRGVRDTQPSPFAFNHVIVRTQVADKLLWLDPTRWTQGGTINTVYQQDYGYALVVDGASDNLTQMFPDGNITSAARRTVAATIDTRQGTNGPAKYTVISTSDGGAADSLRAMLNSVSRDELQKQYVSFYDAYFPGIRSDIKLAVEDDLEANRVITREVYEIPKFWKLSDSRKLREADVRVPDVEVLLKGPRAANRLAPISISFPMELLHTTEVLVPEAWQIKPLDLKIDGPALAFERRIELPQATRIVIRDRVATTADQVSAVEVPQYVEKLTQARGAASYVLTLPDGAATGESTLWERMNGLLATLAAAMVVGWLWLANRAYQWDPATSASSLDLTHNGIGGWLLLIGGGIILAPIRVAYLTWQMLPSYSADSWTNLTNRASDAYHPLWAPVLITELGINIGVFIFSILLIVLFFKKRSNLPNLYIAFVATSLLLNALDLLVARLIPAAAEGVGAKDWTTLGVSIISLAIWGTYFKRSARARSTFVNEYASKPMVVEKSNVQAA